MTHFRSVQASSSLAASLVSAVLLFPGTHWKHSEADLVAQINNITCQSPRTEKKSTHNEQYYLMYFLSFIRYYFIKY